MIDALERRCYALESASANGASTSLASMGTQSPANTAVLSHHSALDSAVTRTTPRLPDPVEPTQSAIEELEHGDITTTKLGADARMLSSLNMSSSATVAMYGGKRKRDDYEGDARIAFTM
jgi:hypothetical protein